MADLVAIRLTVNGQAREGGCETRKLLVDFLREDLGLTGTHVGCEHGLCGACTVLVNGEAARSCLMLALQATGVALLTIEGQRPLTSAGPWRRAPRPQVSLRWPCGFVFPERK